MRWICLSVVLAACASRTDGSSTLVLATPPALPRIEASTQQSALDAMADVIDASDVTVDVAATTVRCPHDMVPVVGNYCPEVEQNCLEWDGAHWRCFRFEAPSRCLASREPMAFCIDRLEWPNRNGALPMVMVTFNEAQALCAQRGRRLCTEREWVFACEGEQMVPYGFSYERSSQTCNVDRPRIEVNEALFRTWPSREARDEVERLDQRARAGSHPACRSPSGALDMIGNVDEWVVNERGRPFASALHGGWWTATRARCRAVTLEHYERFRYYQIGFRCCADGERE